MITETLYPYWKDDPKAAMRVTRESIKVIFCKKKIIIKRHRNNITELTQIN